MSLSKAKADADTKCNPAHPWEFVGFLDATCHGYEVKIEQMEAEIAELEKQLAEANEDQQ